MGAMTRIRRTVIGLAFALATLATLVGANSAAAQSDYAGWYGPYEDGCSYYWDGYQWTGDVDCSAASDSSGYAAGWYDAYGDGCLYWWDGSQYTGDVDCNWDGYADAASSAPGWYDAYGDGCWYWYDGAQYTGAVDCNGDGYADAASYELGWYDPHGDGCLYWYDGAQYTGEADCNGDGYADTTTGTSYAPGWYDPYGDGCLYWWDGSQYTGQVDCNRDGYPDQAGAASGSQHDGTVTIGMSSYEASILTGNWPTRPVEYTGSNSISVGNQGVFIPPSCPPIDTLAGLLCALVIS